MVLSAWQLAYTEVVRAYKANHPPLHTLLPYLSSSLVQRVGEVRMLVTHIKKHRSQRWLQGIT